MEPASAVLLGSLGSLAAGLATALGAIPVVFIGSPTSEQERTMLGFAAGVMLAASFFSLIVPGVAILRDGGAHQALAAGVMAAAVLIGAAAIGALNRYAPVDHLVIGPADAPVALVRRIWLFITAITLHNFPEGMAVGVSFGGGDMATGVTTALGIGVQNVPEGLAVAASLVALGYSRRFAFMGALMSGLVEPIGGVVGATLVAAVQGLLPWGLGFAAGAMIYVVAAEIIPHTQDPRHERSILALMIGLVGMMFLDIALTP